MNKNKNTNEFKFKVWNKNMTELICLCDTLKEAKKISKENDNSAIEWVHRSKC